MSSISESPMGIPFLESNYQHAEGFDVVFKKDPNGERYNLKECSVLYYPDKEKRPAVVLEKEVPPLRGNNQWSVSDRIAWHNMKTCAETLEGIVYPIIDLSKNPKRTPPTAEMRQNISDWRLLTQKFISDVDTLPVEKRPIDEGTIKICKHSVDMADAALRMSPNTCSRSPKVIAAALIVAAAAVIGGYLAYQRQ